MVGADVVVMKTRVFADDGQPESWDCNDNYMDLDQFTASQHVIRWAKRQSDAPAPPAPAPVPAAADRDVENQEGTVRIGA